MVILHALTKKFWDTYKDKSEYGEYSLNKWGFIHCSDINTFHYVMLRQTLNMKRTKRFCF